MIYSEVDVFGFGHCCIDYLCVLDPYPEKGKKGEVIESLVIGGGPVPTALRTIVKLGGTARFCGKVGGDRDGEQVIRELGEAGVDVRPMITDPTETTARAYIWIDPHKASRTVALDRTRFSWMKENQLQDELPVKCKILLTDGRATEASLKGLHLAKKAGITTVLDCGANRNRLEEMLPLVDYAIVSLEFGDSINIKSNTCEKKQSNCREESMQKASEITHFLRENGARVAIVTLGETGSFYSTERQENLIPGFKVKAYDTTGAGDVFHGSFIYGLLQNWSIDSSIRFANAAAALSCRVLSGSRGIPDLTEIQTFIRN